MRYIDLESYYIPKHCIYGPRPMEGVIFNDWEWASITDHLVKGQREKAIATVQAAKEDMKKNISLEMTKNWSNTLASIKTAKENRAEKIAKENEEKTNKYNEILKLKEEEGQLIVQNMRNVRTENRDSTKTINSAILYSVVVEERQKQIDLKNSIKNQEKLKGIEEAKKLEKDLEELRLEQVQEKIKDQMKKRKQRNFLDNQMKEIKERQKELEEEREREKQDLINMRIEEEKIQKCIEAEKKSRRELAARLHETTANRLEYQRNLLLEDEEENEINKIYIRFQREFEKSRKEKEKKLLEEKIELRQKAVDLIAAKLVEARKKEEERINAAIRAKQEEAKEDEKKKAELCRKKRQEINDDYKKLQEAFAQQKYDDSQRKKWEMMQIYKTAEVDCEWRREQRRIRNEKGARTRAYYEKQIRDAQEEKRVEELKEKVWVTQRDMVEIQEVLKLCDEAIDFAKEYNTPVVPIMKAIYGVKKDYGLLNKNLEEFNENCGQKLEEKQSNQKRLRQKCVCLTY